MKKTINSLLIVLLTLIVLLSSAVGVFAEEETSEPSSIVVEVEEDLEDGIIIAEDEYVCGCCHSHQHSNSFGGKFSCFFCKIGTFIKKIFGKREENPVHKYRLVNQYEASCSHEGLTAYKCAVCSLTKEYTTEILPHSPIEVEGRAATCTEKGLTDGVICSECYAVITAQTEIDKKPHSFTSYTSDNNATCTSDGTKTAVCDFCTATDTIADVGSMRDHDEVFHQGSPASCLESGYADYVTCSNCDYSAYRELSKLGHDYQRDTARDLPASCTEKGREAYSCSRCEATNDIETPLLGHDYQRDTARDLPASCTEKGKEAYSCSRCEATNDRETPLLGHDYQRDTARDLPASCTEKGKEAYSCSRCEATNDRETPLLGHDYQRDTARDLPASCTEKGKEAYSCSRCEATNDRETPLLGHDYQRDAARDVPASCTEKGREAYSCSRCEATNDIETQSLGHSLQAIAAVAPTCTQSGSTEGSACNRCDFVAVAPQTIAALGHDFADGTSVANLCTSASSVGTLTADYTCCRCQEALTAEPLSAAASVGGYAVVYHTLETAIASATNQNVYLLRDYTLENDLSLGNGVCLVVPCLADDIGYTQRSDDGYYPYYCPDNNREYHLPKVLYRKLTIPENVTLTINQNGTLLISAVTGIFTGGRPESYGVSGNFAAVDLAGTINVNNGGTLDSSGYIFNGGGEINLANGARLFETYGVRNWRGGSYGSAAKTKKIFPIDEYEIDNIKTPVNYAYGAKGYGTVKMAARESALSSTMKYFYCHMPLIGISATDSLFALGNGATLTKSIENGKEKYVFNGNVALGFTGLTVSGTSLKTNSCQYYKYDGDMIVEFYNGNVTTNQKLFFLPGFEMKIGAGATLTVSSTGGLLFGTANDYTVSGTTYNSYYYYDGQYTNSPANYTVGRGDATLYITDGGRLIMSGTECAIAGKVYVDSSSHFTPPTNAAQKKITRNVAIGDVTLNFGVVPTVSVVEYTVPLMVEEYTR